VNPLLAHGALPRFAEIRAEHVEPAITRLIAEQDAALTAIEARAATATDIWGQVIDALSLALEPLGWAWGVVNHLMGVRNAPDLRAAHEAVQPAVVQASMRVSQSRPVYLAAKRLAAAPEWPRLAEAQRRIVQALVRDAELAGVGLEGAARERFNAIETELAELSTTYSNHVLDATKAFALTLTTKDEVAGLPDSLLAGAAQAARAAGAADATAAAGPWRITLDFPSYGPFMEHSLRRDLRERVLRAQISRASQGETDNQPVIERILALRLEEARLLGFASYAELSVARKMAGTVGAVERLLDELRAVAMPRMRQEFAELQDFARAELKDPAFELRHWDGAFWAERLRERRYSYSDEALRPYFALPRVLDGLFALASRLFGVRIERADATETWHGDVGWFRVRDLSGEKAGADIAAFYLDPYSRPADKRGGAWMDICLNRRRLGSGLRLPVAYLICNQTPPVDGKPSLMTFREVETLFHEFGHGLQHMLTTVDHADAAGINNVEWDAVELPSQFMENWCYHRETVIGANGFAKHWQTGEPLPAATFEKIAAARTFRAATMIMRQVYFATLDIELHHRFKPGAEKPQDVVARIAPLNTVLLPLQEDRALCSFSHIFAGGYSAGYYSYKWAEVLSADAFSAFAEAGLEDPAAIARVGRRFRDTVLAQGGSRHPMQVFKDFRGREPSTTALLKQAGLA